MSVYTERHWSCPSTTHSHEMTRGDHAKDPSDDRTEKNYHRDE